MTLKPGVRVVRSSLSESEFELLLLQAVECTKVSPLRLVKPPQPVPNPVRRKPRPAA